MINGFEEGIAIGVDSSVGVVVVNESEGMGGTTCCVVRDGVTVTATDDDDGDGNDDPGISTS